MFNTRNENASLNKTQQQPYLYTFNAFGRTPRKGILGQEMGQKVQKEEITEMKATAQFAKAPGPGTYQTVDVDLVKEKAKELGSPGKFGKTQRDIDFTRIPLFGGQLVREFN